LTKIHEGELQEATLVLSQLQVLSKSFRLITCELDETAVDMVPVVGSLELEERLEMEARVAVAGAQKAVDEVSVSFISTRSGKAEEMQVSEAMGMALAKYEAAVATWEKRVDRLDKKRREAGIMADRTLVEVRELVYQMSVAFPPQVLNVVMPGVRSLGVTAHPDGTVATPGQLIEAVKRIIKFKRVLSVPEAMAKYAKIFAPLVGLASPKALDIWCAMLSQMRKLHQELAGEVGIFDSFVIGRWLYDVLRKSVGTVAGPGISLVACILVEVGNGKCARENFSLADLLDFLDSPEVRDQIKWLSELSGEAKEPKVTVKAAVARGVGAGTAARGGAGSEGVCYTFKHTGTCSRGDECRFRHDN